MKNSSLLLLIITASTFMMISCKEADKVGLLVPADAGIVVHVNTNSLSKKLSWEEIRNTDWFRNINNDAQDSIAVKLLNEPESSGINIKSDLVFFLKKQGKGGYFAFTGFLKDAKAFESFNQNINKGAPAVKDGEYRTANVNNDGILTWNDKRFIYLVNAPMGNMTGMPVKYQQDDQDDQDEKYNPQQNTANLSPDSLRYFAKQLFTLDGDNSLGKDDKFRDLIKEDGDTHVWVNTGKLYSDMGSGMLSMMKLNVLFDGNISASTLKFDDGKITMKSKQYYGKEMSGFLDKYSSKKIDKALLNRIPSQNIVAVFFMNYPPEGLKEFMRLIGVDGMVNGYLGKLNYSMDEFVKANKGDLLIAITDLTMKTDSMKVPDLQNENGGTMQHKRTTPDMKVLFASSINDRPAFDKLVNTLKNQMGQVPPGAMPEITYKQSNDWFVASNASDYVDKFLAGNKTDHAFADKISGYPYGAYIDIQQIMKSFSTANSDTSGRALMETSLKMWQDIVVTGNAYDDGKIMFEGTVNLVDKKTNSLKQLNQYLNQVYSSFKKRKMPHMDDMPADSSIPAPRRSF